MAGAFHTAKPRRCNEHEIVEQNSASFVPPWFRSSEWRILEMREF